MFQGLGVHALSLLPKANHYLSTRDTNRSLAIFWSVTHGKQRAISSVYISAKCSPE